MSEMSFGAVVMMDALGFKGVWKRFEGPTAITEKMRRMRERAESGLRRITEDRDIVSTARSAFLSDTIVIGVAGATKVKNPGLRHAMALFLAADRAADLLDLARRDPLPRFAYRGCIALGSFEIDGPFILGEAVDEAAEAYELAEGAFVWLAPSARAIWQSLRDRFEPSNSTLVPYAVPLKGGASYATYAVSPFDAYMPPDERMPAADQILATFDGPSIPLAVQIKRQNTTVYLRSLIAPGAQDEVGPIVRLRKGDLED
jgi:hypothetical protein